MGERKERRYKRMKMGGGSDENRLKEKGKKGRDGRYK